LMFQAEIHAQTIRQQHQLKWREHSENLALNPVYLEPRRRRHSKAS
jgi:hypothetical protein